MAQDSAEGVGVFPHIEQGSIHRHHSRRGQATCRAALLPVDTGEPDLVRGAGQRQAWMTASAFAEYAFSMRRSVQTVSVAAYSDMARISPSVAVCGTAGGSPRMQETATGSTALGSDAQPDSAAHIRRIT